MSGLQHRDSLVGAEQRARRDASGVCGRVGKSCRNREIQRRQGASEGSHESSEAHLMDLEGHVLER